ncbi:MAG: hypothetical protein AAB092_08545 [Chloroflexota bacterium]
MSSARRPLPTDIVALVSFDGKVYPNEAKPLDHLGLEDRTRPLENALEQWFSFATGKHTWVSVHGATIRGLISARPRAKRSAWEVEVLINASDDESIALSLFSRMTAGVIKQGAERVFLRLASDSVIREAARSAGFFRYATETLYRREAKNWSPANTDVAVRTKSKNDVFGMYQLYNRVAPANVRSIEGLTLREWQAAQEKWGGRCTDLLLEESGVITAWVRAMPGHVGRIAVLAERGPYDQLLGAGLDLLQDRDVFCLVPDYNPEMASALERCSFEPVCSYMSYAKRLTKPVEELATETSSNPVPVG